MKTSSETSMSTRRETLVALGVAGIGIATACSTEAAPNPPLAPKELAGKAAIVTGARNGADVLVHYHRTATREEAEETARLVRAHGVKAALVDGDLGQVANVRKLYETATKELGRVDIVVNNAGYIRKAPFVDITEEELDRAIAINTKGLFLSMQEAARRIADNGRIINIGTSLLADRSGTL